MGEIINTKVYSDKIRYKIKMDYDEAIQLRNHIKNVHMISLDLCDQNTKIIQRGNKGGAKYFVIPLSLKSRKKKRYSKVSYQKIELEDKIFYICVANKDLLF